MPGWIWQTIVYVPLVLNFLRTVPLVLTPAILPRFGPLVMITLCGSEPVHWNFTVSPEWMVSRDGPNFRWGPTLTVFVAANAGTAIAAATVATATSSAMRRFMRCPASWCRWERCFLEDAGRYRQLPGQMPSSSAG